MSVRPPVREPGYDEAEHSGPANRLITARVQVSIRAESTYMARAQVEALLREMIADSHLLDAIAVET